LSDALGQAGMVFDRARLCMLAEQNEVSPHLTDWKPNFFSFSQKVSSENSMKKASSPGIKANSKRKG
jgi:hypothetical protein